MKPCEFYLLFYTVDEAVKTVTVLRVMQDGMDWQYIIKGLIILVACAIDMRKYRARK